MVFRHCGVFLNIIYFAESEIVIRALVRNYHKNFKKAATDFRNAILLDPAGKNLWANRARSLVIAIKRSMDADRPSTPARRRTS